MMQGHINARVRFTGGQIDSVIDRKCDARLD